MLIYVCMNVHTAHHIESQTVSIYLHIQLVCNMYICFNISSVFTGACADIDECSMYPDLCKGGGSCVNTPGSFVCQCAPGLVLDPTGMMCIGEKITFSWKEVNVLELITLVSK